MYKVGEYVVYKKNVCKIKEYDKKYYCLVPVDDVSLTIKVPVETSKEFLRKVISKKQVESIISSINYIEVLPNISEKEVEQSYKELLRNGNYEDIIKIIKTSYLRNQDRINNNKKISERDDYYFKLAERMLYNEFSIALGKSFEETKKYVVDKVNNN